MSGSQELQSRATLKNVLAWLEVGRGVFIVDLFSNANLYTADGVRHFDDALEVDHGEVRNGEAG